MTRQRWREQPETLIPLKINDINNLAQGESRRRITRVREEAMAREKFLLARLNRLPVDESVIRATQQQYAYFESLNPPRVITSEGEFSLDVAVCVHQGA